GLDRGAACRTEARLLWEAAAATQARLHGTSLCAPADQTTSAPSSPDSSRSRPTLPRVLDAAANLRSAAQQLSILATSLAGVGGGSSSSQLVAARLQLALGQTRAACNAIGASPTTSKPKAASS